MKKRPIATTSLTLIALAITSMAPLFDTSVYSLNEHPTQWMSFMPSTPFRYMGLTFISSPFIHLNLEHFFVNTLFLLPIGMIIERKKTWTYLAVLFLLVHFQTLLSLIVIDSFYTFQAKAFLGYSHIVIGIYTFWFVKNKKYGSLTLAILILIAGLWQTQSPLTILAHVLGLAAGIVILILERLTRVSSINSSD
ncbi:rhomboid family intramembrane serine protease [Halobacteriovorax sp.]|uniref:rhomboid family intramembrane serine protease n=1 Tax=Halobacteriovorax sp. TaxID=2020862 RepID=UPI0035653D18